MAGAEERPFKPKDTIAATLQGIGVCGGVGLLMASVQNTLQRQNVGAWGVVSKFGGTTMTFTAVGGSYSFFKHASANLREKDDAWNSVIGGLVGGTFIGLRSGAIHKVVAMSCLTAAVMGTFEYTGGRLTGNKQGSDVDLFEQKQALRANKRRPIQETIDILGEYRGIRGPGFAERRAARIKEAYGIDVPGGKA